MLHIPKTENAEIHFKALGLPEPPWEKLTELWQYSFWAQRRLLQSLNEAIRNNICIESAKAAKEYYQLINGAMFFIPDARDQISELLSAHFDHKALAASAAYEIETGNIEFGSPPQTNTFKNALFRGKYFPIQACLYLGHRARLYVLKSIVGFWLARERGEIKKTGIKFDDFLVDLTDGQLTQAMASGINELSSAKSFRLFPVFWQVFLWSWGGFLLENRLDEEYVILSQETGVPIDEISLALSAFDKLFPVNGGWFRTPTNNSRKVLTLMPAAMRGIGSFRRKLYKNVEHYKELGYSNEITNRMTEDHNTGARLLDCPDDQLAI